MTANQSNYQAGGCELVNLNDALAEIRPIDSLAIMELSNSLWIPRQIILNP